MTPLERRVNMAAVFLPFAVTAAAIPLLWGSWLGWSDVAVFVFMYLISGLGVTVGFHRMLTHRAFQTHKATRYLFAYMGMLSVQGPVIDWVADHRKHHAHTDVEGDPHSPHVGHGDGVMGALRGLWHAHAAWLWETHGQARAHKYAKDLVEDRGMRILNRKFPLIVARQPADPGRPRRPAELEPGKGALTGLDLGRLRPHLPPAPRHLVGQLGLPLLRQAPLRRRGSVDQRLLARDPVLRRELAPQPPRLPALRRARPEVVGDRPVRDGHRPDAARRPRLGRRQDHARAPGAEAGRRREARRAAAPAEEKVAEPVA